MLDDWTWWVWTVTVALLTAGLCGYSFAFVGAMALTAGQGLALAIRERSLGAFSVWLRIVYLLLLLVCYPPFLRWLYVLPAAGTLALIIFGYCLLARVVSLLPWNRREPLSLDLLRRTFLSAPDLSRRQNFAPASGCAGGLCTIEAQVAPAKKGSSARWSGRRKESFA